MNPPAKTELWTRLVRSAPAFAVHLFTASGAALALLALIAAAERDWRMMFVWLGIALIVDGLDGALARKANVSERLPRWRGEVLDLVIDYATYVLVPAFAIALGGFTPPAFGLVLGCGIAMSGALYFADGLMKTPDHYFRGFPALWNLAAFYLFLLRPGSGATAIFVAALVILTFAPIRVIHPVRVARLRAFNLALTAIWGVLALAVLIWNFVAPLPVTIVLCAIGLYVLFAGTLVPMRSR